MQSAQLLHKLETGQADIVDFTQHLSAKAKQVAWQAALQSVADLRQVGLLPDTIVFNVAGRACAGGTQRHRQAAPGSWTHALHLLHTELPMQRLEPDAVSFGTATSALRTGGRADEASRYLADLAAASLRPGLTSHNTVISAYAERGRWQDAIRQSELATESGLTSDEFTCTSVINACRQEPQAWLLSCCFLEQYVGIQASLGDEEWSEAVFNAALSSCGASGWAFALCTATRLKQRARRLGAASLATLVSTRGWAHALEELHGCTGRIGDFIGLVQALGRASEQGPSHAANLLRQLPEMRAHLHPALWGTALGACGQKGAWDLALVLLGDMSQRALQHDAECLASALDASDAAGTWGTALQLLDDLLEGAAAGTKPGGSEDLLCATGLSACAQSSWRLAPELLRQATKSGLRPSSLSWCAMLPPLDVDSWACALEVLAGVGEQSVPITSSLLGAVVNSLKPWSTEWRLASGLLQWATAWHVQTHVGCHNAATGLFASASAWAAAVQQLDNMHWSWCHLDRISVQASLAACLAGLRWRPALSVLSHGDISGQEVNIAAQVMAQAAQWFSALSLLRSARGRGLVPDTTSLPGLATAMQQAKPDTPLWQAGLAQLLDARSRRQVVGTDTYQAIIVSSF
ncbi:unnamed protein product [Symbiodinium natans]|uniref:Pentatricopeptide repeat-containing protein, chloroplastic n=1 Tax=Symbiodinium natans TaxID=878477 RepID=A0A812QZV7_9DINO|nr:unnamed protein product [Symbiodinium natans]